MYYIWNACFRSRVCALLFTTTLFIACSVAETAPRSTGIETPLLYITYGDASDTVRLATISSAGALNPLPPNAPLPSTPALEGLKYADIQPNARIPSLYLPLLSDLVAIKETFPDLYSGISTVTLINKSPTSYEVLLFTRFTPLSIVSSVPISIDNLAAAIAAITNSALTAVAQEAKYISIRGATPVIRYDRL